MSGWEKFINKDGRKDVRPVGASSDAVVVQNDAYHRAKRQMVQEEKRQKALADVRREYARNERALAAKAGPARPSSTARALAEVNRAVKGSAPGRGRKP